MSRVDFLRASGWVGPGDLKEQLTIIGCGAIGSNVALLAAKMGWRRFSLWDADVVEAHNLPNQAFTLKHVGQPKVLALQQVLMEFNPDCSVETHEEYFTASHKDLVIGPLVIATDTMASRDTMTSVFAENLEIPLVVEARLSFDYGEIHCIDPTNATHIADWRASLKSDDEIPDGPCNRRICATLVGTVASLMVHYLCVPYAERREGKEPERPWETRIMLRDYPILRTSKT